MDEKSVELMLITYCCESDFRSNAEPVSHVRSLLLQEWPFVGGVSHLRASVQSPSRLIL